MSRILTGRPLDFNQLILLLIIKIIIHGYSSDSLLNNDSKCLFVTSKTQKARKIRIIPLKFNWETERN